MEGIKKERWLDVCEQAATEKDSKKLMELTKEIDRLLGEKQDRLNRKSPDNQP
jgi:hypothetical protein